MSDDVHARLAEIRAQRAALAEAKAKRDAENAEQELIAAEEQALKDETALVDAEQEHGPSFVFGEDDPGTRKLAVVKTSLGMVFVSRAAPIIFQRFIRTGKTGEKELSELVFPNLTYPTKTRFTQMLDEQPALLARCANAIVEMAGARSQEIAGK